MKKVDFFWISYSDLMTSMFFIMLVLFVLVIGYLQYQKNATEKQLEKIQELQTAVRQLPEQYFEYQSQYKRFKLKRQIQFPRGNSEIPDKDRQYLVDVGMSIFKLIYRLNDNPNYRDLDIKYLIVIEGMASRDNYPHNFELSYKRALSLYNLWNSAGITFDPSNCEVQISGSGIKGIREYFGIEEYKNQQFLIHIIPKMGKITENE
jgi:outer membrane protein OmpA-like peptidoglycan-associated protein